LKLDPLSCYLIKQVNEEVNHFSCYQFKLKVQILGDPA
jgi:hypothetical protein